MKYNPIVFISVFAISCAWSVETRESDEEQLKWIKACQSAEDSGGRSPSIRFIDTNTPVIGSYLKKFSNLSLPKGKYKAGENLTVAALHLADPYHQKNAPYMNGQTAGGHPEGNAYKTHRIIRTVVLIEREDGKLIQGSTIPASGPKGPGQSEYIVVDFKAPDLKGKYRFRTCTFNEWSDDPEYKKRSPISVRTEAFKVTESKSGSRAVTPDALSQPLPPSDSGAAGAAN